MDVTTDNRDLSASVAQYWWVRNSVSLLLHSAKYHRAQDFPHNAIDFLCSNLFFGPFYPCVCLFSSSVRVKTFASPTTPLEALVSKTVFLFSFLNFHFLSFFFFWKSSFFKLFRNFLKPVCPLYDVSLGTKTLNWIYLFPIKHQIIILSNLMFCLCNIINHTRYLNNILFLLTINKLILLLFYKKYS